MESAYGRFRLLLPLTPLVIPKRPLSVFFVERTYSYAEITGESLVLLTFVPGGKQIVRVLPEKILPFSSTAWRDLEFWYRLVPLYRGETTGNVQVEACREDTMHGGLFTGRWFSTRYVIVRISADGSRELVESPELRSLEEFRSAVGTPLAEARSFVT